MRFGFLGVASIADMVLRPILPVTPLSIFIRKLMYVCIFTYMYICMYVHIYIYIYIYKYMCIHIYTCIRTCIYIHTHIVERLWSSGFTAWLWQKSSRSQSMMKCCSSLNGWRQSWPMASL